MGLNDNYYHEWPYDSMPGRDEQWLKRERKKYKPYIFMSEHMMQWIGTSNPLLPIEKIQGRIDILEACPPKPNQMLADKFGYNYDGSAKLSLYLPYDKDHDPYNPDHQYLLAFDAATGAGRDWSAAQLLDITACEVPMVYHSVDIGLDISIQLFVKFMSNMFGNCPIVMEKNGLGQGAIAYARECGILNRFYQPPPPSKSGSSRTTLKSLFQRVEYDEDDIRTYGWWTSKESKMSIYETLRRLIDQDKLKIYDLPTLYELLGITSYVSGKIEAEHGSDDLSDALAMAVGIGMPDVPVFDINVIKGVDMEMTRVLTDIPSGIMMDTMFDNTPTDWDSF